MSQYQAVYDATLRAFDISNVTPLAQQAIGVIQYDWTRPSVLFRPSLSLDGNSWIALLGDNLQSGCVGVGDSPDAAMCDFDVKWYKKVGK